MIVMFRKLALGTIFSVSVLGTAAMAFPRGSGNDCNVFGGLACRGFYGSSDWREEELGFRVSCDEARGIVRDRGYRKIRISNCGVRSHQFTGWRDGNRYLIKINGYNGNIASIRRID
jgi:hypothetical protein